VAKQGHGNAGVVVCVEAALHRECCVSCVSHVAIYIIYNG